MPRCSAQERSLPTLRHRPRHAEHRDLAEVQGRVILTTRDALDALSVAHDALIEGRDGVAAMTEAAPWARYDRLLPRGHYTFVPKSLQEHREEMIAMYRKQFGPTVDLGSDTVLGILVDKGAQMLYDISKTYENMWPDKATGADLDAIVEQTKP